MHEQLRFVASLTDAQLIDEVDNLAVKSRDVTAHLIASLAEFDARRLYVSLGFSSLCSYCEQRLRLSEQAAYNRIQAARAAQDFPIILDRLASGDITMTTVTMLRPYLTEENHVQLLEAARHKSKRQVEAQVAAMGRPRELRSVVHPIGGGRYRLEIAISEETRQTLERLQDLMRHRIPSGDPADIVARALSTLLTEVERQRLAHVRNPRGNSARISHSRYIPAFVRHEVWKRDGSQCAFVGSAGRCPERGFLEIHHVVPFSEGGPTTLENLQLRCRIHNVYEWEQHGVSPA